MAQQQTIIQTGGAAYDSFGYSVALSSDGNTALVGAASDDVGSNNNQGSATIFTRSNGVWTEQQTITKSDGAAGDQFGWSVALSSDGNTALVGANLDDDGGIADQGSATIFIRSGTTWTQQQAITGGAAGDRFGFSVALSSDGNTALIGAAYDDVGSTTDQGSATIFIRTGTTWTQQQTIIQTGAAANDYFGWSVALSSTDGNTALIGALYADVPNNNQGSATIFTRSSGVWTQQQTITQSDGAADDQFGVSVALSSDGNTALVGAASDDAPNNNQGSATIFTRSGTAWTEQQTITQADGAASDFFGWSVDLSNDGSTAFVGALYADVEGTVDQGSATIFTRSSGVWTQQQAITQTGGAASDQFGYSVALSSYGSTALVGARNATVGGNAGQGSATVFFGGTVPGAPTGVAATTASTQSVVSWIAPANDGGATITGYTVTASPGGLTCSWTSGALSCTVTGLTNGTAYTFTARATNSIGVSSSSAASSAVTPRTVPGAPTGVAATTASTQSVVSWTAPASNGGATITGYTVTASPGGLTCSWTSGALSCTVTGLTNGTAYTFAATATNTAGTSSASTASSAVTPVAVPGAPTGVAATTASTQSVVSWTAPADNGGATITGYTVTANPGGQTCSWTSGALSCIVTGLTNGTAYTFTATATNSVGVSSSSIASSVVTPSGGNGFTSDPITIPTGVQWSVEDLALVARFAGTIGLTYTIRATQSSTIKTGACVDTDSFITCTVRVAAGTWTGEVTPYQGATSGDSVAKRLAATWVASILRIKWVASSITKRVKATFSASPGTTYMISATRTKAAKSINSVSTRGLCKIKTGKVVCSIKLKSNGAWKVTITPRKNGSFGTPAKKTVKITRKKLTTTRRSHQEINAIRQANDYSTDSGKTGVAPVWWTG